MQQLVRMTRSILSYAIIIALTLAVSGTRLRKCCPEGMVLSMSPKMDCTIPEKYPTELITVDPEIAVHQNELPNCNYQKDFTKLTKYYRWQVDKLKINQALCCVELLQTSTNRFTLIGVDSLHSENIYVEERELVTNESPLQLLRISKCCPRDYAFNELSNYCVKNVDSSENYSNIHEFISLLPKLPFHIIMVTHGYNLCDHDVLVTYEIATEDIEYQNQRLLVTISEDGRHQKRQIDVFNGCLELTPNSTSSRKLLVRFCGDSAYCESHSCVRKCCVERHFVSDTFECNNGNSSSTQSAFYDALSNFTKPAWSRTGHGVLFDFNCDKPYKLNSSEILGLTKEGYLRENFGLEHPLDSYCLDVFDNGSVLFLVCYPEYKPDIPPINRTSVPFKATWLSGRPRWWHNPISSSDSRYTMSKEYRFFDDWQLHWREEDTIFSHRYAITSLLKITSCVFLLLTLLVYSYLPYLQNLHGKTLMCNAASLFVSYICIAIVPWTKSQRAWMCTTEDCTSIFCVVLGYTTLFSWLSTFSWLNIMCFDIWQTFGKLRDNHHGGQSNGKKFLLYSTYAWGLPLFITLCGVVIHQLSFLPDFVKPYIGQKRCWFAPNRIGDLIFFILPVAIQLTSNVVFFILTAKHCSKVKAEIRRMTDEPPVVMCLVFYADKAKLIMNLKLFIVMGIAWVAEIGSVLVAIFIMDHMSHNIYVTVFYVSDIINCLHGVLIFILFVAKPEVYRALKEQLRLWREEEGLYPRDVHDPRPEYSENERQPTAETNV